MRSPSVCRWRSRLAGALPLTLFGKAEIPNAMALAAFRGDVTAAQAEQSRAFLLEDLADGRLHLADLLWRAALERCAEISRAHTPTLGTRTLDVLHVASALELGSRLFVSHDTRPLRLAKSCRLRVFSRG